ncbi:hypothetical protein LCGC14_2366020 [marine sediment metagenome]|uniref:RNA polymerase sigma-70 region 4 domain-containing protein n=1 Tax=marine sediment metagenome TaxID=412755 RepID=A0A0F9EHP1_9ZZZZ
MRPKKEVLVGDEWKMELLAQKHQQDSLPEHSLQLVVEMAVAALSAQEQEIFWMRFGELLPIRTIAKKLGYSSHQIIQAKIARIQKEVREYVDKRREDASSDS